MRNSVVIPFVREAFDDQGQPKNPMMNAAADIMLDDLAWWSAALEQARAAGELTPGNFRPRAALAGGNSLGPDYPAHRLPGMLLTGVGVNLTLPTRTDALNVFQHATVVLAVAAFTAGLVTLLLVRVRGGRVLASAGETAPAVSPAARG